MRFTGRVFFFAVFVSLPFQAVAISNAASEEDLHSLVNSVTNPATQPIPPTSTPPATSTSTVVSPSPTPPTQTLVLNPKSLDSRYRFAVGVSYTGGQLRYQFTPKWAAEYRYQYGQATSDYGDVKATVLGLRGYRFVPYRRNLSWYLGTEGAYASAKAHNTNSNYEVSGFALGAFGGIEYRVIPRIAISADIGPYAISLKEKQTNMSQTNLDFVINTAINFYLF